MKSDITFDFYRHWNNDHAELDDLAIEIVNSMIKSGLYTQEEAILKIEAFQKNSFRQGESEEAFMNCEDDA